MINTNARQSKLKIFARHVFTSLSTVALATALLWGVARPHAQQFITDTIKDQNFVSKQQLDSIDDRLKRLEGKVQGVESSLEDQRTRQTRVETSLQTLEDLQREQRADTKLILRSIRN